MNIDDSKIHQLKMDDGVADEVHRLLNDELDYLIVPARMDDFVQNEERFNHLVADLGCIANAGKSALDTDHDQDHSMLCYCGAMMAIAALVTMRKNYLEGDKDDA